jgi:flagellin-like protein
MFTGKRYSYIVTMLGRNWLQKSFILCIRPMPYEIQGGVNVILEKFFRSKKAISPVIATLLLILVAVASSLVLYTYVMGYLGSMTKGGSSMQGVLSLDSASASATTSTITAYVRNVGSVSVSITNAYVDDVSYDITSAVDINPGNVGTVAISGLSLQAGTSYTVKLVAKDGTSLVFNVKP